MKRRWRLFATALLSALAVLAASSAALGRSTADDLSVRVHLLRDATATTTTSLSNDMQFDVFSDGPAQTATMRFSLPAGLTFGVSDQPDATENCTNGSPVVCTMKLEDGVSGFVLSWSWPIVASGPGTYAITATVEGERADPNAADNSFTFTFQVQPTGGSGGGGGGGGGGSVTVSASAVKLTPAKPKAGSAVTATASVTANGNPVKPSKVVCAGTLAGKKAIGTGQALTGKASCRYPTLKSAKGKTLAGSMKITARGKTITKRFSTKLG